MKTEFNYQFGPNLTNVSIEPHNNYFRVTVGDTVYEVTADRFEMPILHFQINGQRIQVHVAPQNEQRYVAVSGHIWRLQRPTAGQIRRKHSAAEAGAASGRLESAMPGLVLDVFAQDGDTVAQGQTLILLEAMKMEMRVTAPFAGRVKKIHCANGQLVERGQLLAELETT